ncbi:MAG: IS30 family transposase [Phycisphaerales bacterium]|jgi:IS30 family transposase
MTYTQITPHERYALSLLRQQGYTQTMIARALGRHRSTISREVRRNVWREDGRTYRPGKAQSYTNHRRRVSRRNAHFTPGDWAAVEAVLREDWSPEQVVGWFARFHILAISHETIYRYVWKDKHRGGTLWMHLRVATKRVRKRYGRYDSRGRLAGKRHITDRPAGAEHRSRFGHWEGDTLLGNTQHGACAVTMVERKSGFTAIGLLARRAAPDVNARLRQLIAAQPRPVRTITLDNGTEFHSYKALEATVDARCYFATPHHAWERGTNENTNGLIRQYLKKRHSMEHLTQADCQRIADRLNRRPRKRLGFRTPEEVYVP